MEKKVTKVENEQVTIDFKAEAEEWKLAQDKEFKKLAAKVKVPGFRDGHVPADLAKKHINPGEVLHEAMFTLVNKAFKEAIEADKLDVFTQPKLNVKNITETELEVTVSFALPPKVELGEYKGLHAEKKAVVVEDKDVENYIDNLRKQNATLVVKDAPAALGDTVIIDFKGFVDGVAFDGGEAKGYSLELGSHSFVPGFEEALVGIKAGEKKTIDVKFPENYVESLAGKDAKFNVTCSEVKNSVLPELGQELIDDLQIKDVKDVESLKKYAHDQIEVSKNTEANNQYLDDLVNQAIDNAKVSIGEDIILEEANAMIDNIKKQVAQTGLKYEDYLKINKIDEKQMLEDKKVEATKNLKSMLVVETICAKEKIVVDDAALEQEYEKLAAQYSMKVEDVKKAIEPSKEQFGRQLRSQLFAKFMLDNNK